MCLLIKSTSPYQEIQLKIFSREKSAASLINNTLLLNPAVVVAGRCIGGAIQLINHLRDEKLLVISRLRCDTNSICMPTTRGGERFYLASKRPSWLPMCILSLEWNVCQKAASRIATFSPISTDGLLYTDSSTWHQVRVPLGDLI